MSVDPCSSKFWWKFSGFFSGGQVFTAPYPHCLYCKARTNNPNGSDWYKVRQLCPAAPRCAALR
jgi:hypothetical protein